MKALQDCLAHALVIAIANVNIDPNYDGFRKERKIRHAVQTLLEMTGMDLSNGAMNPKLFRFQEQFR